MTHPSQIFPTVFVLHVAHGFEDRARHIDSMLERLGIPFEYILRGDIPDVTLAVLDEYFKGVKPGAFGSVADKFTSCTYKHLIACEEIVKRNLPGALVLEDDIVLHRNFVPVFRNAVKELEAMPDAPSIISFEDTRLRFVPRSKREKGKLLYPGICDRMAGCIYVSNAGARLVLDYAREHGMHLPIDNFHDFLLRKGLLRYLWCQPTVACQGSFTGLFTSSLSKRYSRIVTPLVWQFKLAWHKMLYEFR